MQSSRCFYSLRMILYVLLLCLTQQSATHAQTLIQPQDSANQRIHEALARPINAVAFEAAPLREAFDIFRVRCSIDTHVNWAALETAGIKPDRPVSLTLREVPAETLLRLLTWRSDHHGFPLSYVVRDGKLIISTEKALSEKPVQGVYSVGDLLPAIPKRRHDPDTPAAAMKQMTRLITSLVDAELWEVNGGRPGKIRVEANTLIVEHTPHVHGQIAALLNLMRVRTQSMNTIVPERPSLAPYQDEAILLALRRELTDLEYKQLTLEQVFADLRKRLNINMYVHWQSLEKVGIKRDWPISLNVARLPAGRVLRLVLDMFTVEDIDLDYPVSDGVLEITLRCQGGLRQQLRAYPVSNLLANVSRISDPDTSVPESPSEELINLLKMTVQPDSWSDHGGLGAIGIANDVLFVRNSEPVCEEVRELLATLDSLVPGGHVHIAHRYTSPEHDQRIKYALSRPIGDQILEQHTLVLQR